MDDKDTEGEYDSSLERDSVDTIVKPAGSGDSSPTQSDESKPPRWGRFTLRRIILIVVIILILLAALGSFLVLKHDVNKPRTVVINTQSLSNGTLNKIISQNGGKPTAQQLTINPDTIFKNEVTIQGSGTVQKDLTVDANLGVKGAATIQGATSTGALSAHGSLGVAGNATIGGNLTVSGLINAASISVGSITTTNLTLNGDVGFGGHLVPAGAAPSAQPSVAASGGTVSISGNDTAGKVTITIGPGAQSSGELAIIHFAKAFALAPYVQLTPADQQATATTYYVTVHSTFFTIELSAAPTRNAVYQFNYLVAQ